MNAYHIGIVICRVAAAVLVVQAIAALGHFLPALSMFTGEPGFLATLLFATVTVIVPALAALVLWTFAPRIVGKPPAAETGTDAARLEAGDIVRVGTLLIGLYLAVTGVISAFGVEATVLMQPDEPEMSARISRYSARLAGERVTYVLKMLLGIALMLGRDRIASIATRARRAGVAPRN